MGRRGKIRTVRLLTIKYELISLSLQETEDAVYEQV